jgi:hypothetical protein
VPVQTLFQSGVPATPAVLPTSFNSLFNATENPVSESAVWLNGKANAVINNDVQTTGGIACATAINNPAGPFDDSIAILNPARVAIGPNQSVTVTVSRTAAYTPTNNHEINLFLRGAMVAGSIRGYEVNLSLKGDYGFIVLWLGGGNTSLSFFVSLTSISHPALVDGDVIYAEIVGTVITVKLNGSTLGTYDTAGDTTKWSSGSPGIDFWAETGSTLTSAGVKDFTAATL